MIILDKGLTGDLLQICYDKMLETWARCKNIRPDLISISALNKSLSLSHGSSCNVRSNMNSNMCYFFNSKVSSIYIEPGVKL